MARQEKTYQTELKRSFNHYLKQNDKHGIWWKIPDTGYCRKPYDSWCLCDGKFYAMEQKINKAVKTFNFKSFFRDRDHEITALEKVEKCGGISYVTINHFRPREINTAYALPVWIVKRAYEKGSISLDHMKEVAIEIPRIKNEFKENMWDISVLFN